MADELVPALVSKEERGQLAKHFRKEPSSPSSWNLTFLRFPSPRRVSLSSFPACCTRLDLWYTTNDAWTRYPSCWERWRNWWKPSNAWLRKGTFCFSRLIETVSKWVMTPRTMTTTTTTTTGFHNYPARRRHYALIPRWRKKWYLLNLFLSSCLSLLDRSRIEKRARSNLEVSNSRSRDSEWSARFRRNPTKYREWTPTFRPIFRWILLWRFSQKVRFRIRRSSSPRRPPERSDGRISGSVRNPDRLSSFRSLWPRVSSPARNFRQWCWLKVRQLARECVLGQRGVIFHIQVELVFGVFRERLFVCR